MPQGSTPSRGPSLGPRRGSPSQARAPVSPTGRRSLTPGGHLGAKQAEQQQREGHPARHGARRAAQGLSREWRADGGGGRDTPRGGAGAGCSAVAPPLPQPFPQATAPAQVSGEPQGQGARAGGGARPFPPDPKVYGRVSALPPLFNGDPPPGRPL